MLQWLQPEGWPRPKGYSNGVVLGPGDRLVILGGQVGWDEHEKIVPGGFVSQFEQALKNVVTVVKTGGGRIEDIVQLRLYIVDRAAYLSQAKELGAAYRRVMGKHFPCMSGLVIAGLVEDGAVIEIEGVAVLPAGR